MVDWILDRIARCPSVDEVHVVTNARYAPTFERWAAAARTSSRPRRRHDARTTTGSARSATSASRSSEAGSRRRPARDRRRQPVRLPLADYVACWRAKGVASALAVHDVGDLELARQYGIVELDEGDRVVGLRREAGAIRRSTLAATATYLYHREHVPLVARYLDEGNPPDQPGRFIAWLHTREPVYGYVFEGEWLDIGDPAQLLEADNRMRRRSGLPERAEYASRLTMTHSAHSPAQTRHTFPAYRRDVLGCSSTCSSRALPRLPARRRRALRRLPRGLRRLARPSARAAARPPRGRSRAAASAPGRRLAFAQARAALATTTRRGRSSAPGRSAACAGSPGSPPSSSPRRAAPAVAALAFVPPDGDRSARARPPPGRAARARARPRLGAPGRAAARPRPRPSGSSAASRSPSGGGTSPARSGPRATRRAASAWSTTSTRPARPSGRRLGAPQARRAACRGRHLRARRTLILDRLHSGDSDVSRGETDATSGQGQERRGQRLDPRVRGAEAGQARAAAGRSDADRARARGGAEPVDRGDTTSPRRRSGRRGRHCAPARRRRT